MVARGGVLYREAHQLIEEIHEARQLGELRKYRAQMKAVELLIIDDLFLRKLPVTAGEELADVLMSRYEKLSTIVTSNRPVDDWPKLLGDVVVVTPRPWYRSRESIWPGADRDASSHEHANDDRSRTLG